VHIQPRPEHVRWDKVYLRSHVQVVGQARNGYGRSTAQAVVCCAIVCNHLYRDEDVATELGISYEYQYGMQLRLRETSTCLPTHSAT